MPVYKTAAELPHKGTYTVAEAKVRLGMGEKKLRKLLKAGEMGYLVRIWRWGHYQRRAIFIPVSEVKAYLVRKIIKGHLGSTIEWHPPKLP